MFASAGFSFILYLLIFFRLRGNITLEAGYKVRFQRRPKVRVGRTTAGTYIMTDDRRVESHLTTVAKQMLWYPIAYTVLVLPIAASRFSTFSGDPVPFSVTIFTAAVFMLSGFVNAVLFCLTRNVLPGSWRQRFGIGTTLNSGQANTGIGSRPPAAWRATASAVRAGTAPVILSINVEKNVEIKYGEAESQTSFLNFGSPTRHTAPLPAHGGGWQRDDSYNQHTRHPPYPAPRDARKSVRFEADRDGDGDDADSVLDIGVYPATKVNTVGWEVPQHPGHAPDMLESGMYGPAPGLEARASVHPFATARPGNIDVPRARSSSLLTFDPAVNHTRPAWASGDSGGNGGGTHWAGSNQ